MKFVVCCLCSVSVRDRQATAARERKVGDVQSSSSLLSKRVVSVLVFVRLLWVCWEGSKRADDCVIARGGWRNVFDLACLTLRCVGRQLFFSVPDTAAELTSTSQQSVCVQLQPPGPLHHGTGAARLANSRTLYHTLSQPPTRSRAIATASANALRSKRTQAASSSRCSRCLTTPTHNINTTSATKS